MTLSHIDLKNFRIHKNLFLTFSDKINYIIGGNGTGKTSILDSIYFLCTTKGYTSKKDSDAVNFNSAGFEISGKFKDLTENDVRVTYSTENNKKHYLENSKHIFRTTDIIGRFPVVVLSPSDHSITDGFPGDRRKFVDSVICQSNPVYLKTLLDYNRTLRQRSSLLSRIKEKRSRDLFVELEAWNTRIVNTGSMLIEYRKQFIRKFEDFLKESYNVIMEDVEVPSIQYFFLDGYKGEKTEEQFTKLLTEKKEEEVRRSLNLTGPHRDDFIFRLNNLKLKDFGSQGQHKTFQVSLKFAQFFFLENSTGKKPIFLFDDVFGELDLKRSSRINDYLKRVGQAFITLTDLSSVSFLPSGGNNKVIKLAGEEMHYA